MVDEQSVRRMPNKNLHCGEYAQSNVNNAEAAFDLIVNTSKMNDDFQAQGALWPEPGPDVQGETDILHSTEKGAVG
jgi:hypothetical protein